MIKKMLIIFVLLCVALPSFASEDLGYKRTEKWWGSLVEVQKRMEAGLEKIRLKLQQGIANKSSAEQAKVFDDYLVQAYPGSKSVKAITGTWVFNEQGDEVDFSLRKITELRYRRGDTTFRVDYDDQAVLVSTGEWSVPISMNIYNEVPASFLVNSSSPYYDILETPAGIQERAQRMSTAWKTNRGQAFRHMLEDVYKVKGAPSGTRLDDFLVKFFKDLTFRELVYGVAKEQFAASGGPTEREPIKLSFPTVE